MNGLNFIRTRCNISLSELADILDVSRQQISAWENGVKPICQKRLSQLSKYFGKTDKIIEEVGAINRGCKVYDLLTTYMNQMPNEAPGMSMVFYYMVRNVLFSLLISQDLMTREELDKEFTYDKGIPLYDDRSWICELAEIFKKKYDEKREISKEISIRIKEDNKEQNTN